MNIRNNTASALTRAIKPALTGVTVKVKSDDYTKSATITGEIEQLMRAREYLSKDARFRVTVIKTYSVLPSAFYVLFANQRP